MKITVRTPNRIDFAGGTLDLYPLYLFMDGGLTVNAGVTIFSNAEIESRDDGKIFIRCLDLNAEAMYDSADELDLKGATSLIQRVIKSYRPPMGINITTRNDAPKGSGLGASSSLMVAVASALISLRGETPELNNMVDRIAAIEAGHLGIPTGKQDYYGAALGKVHALHFDEKGCTPEAIPMEADFSKALEESLIVSFTGISHYSGANNWDMLKMAIDRTGNTYENLFAIRDVAIRTRQAFLNQDLSGIGRLAGEEWEIRKTLSHGITNEFIDSVMEEIKKAGAWGSKLCGAGGGGCMITLAPVHKRNAILSVMENHGVKPMSAVIDFAGLNITRTSKSLIV